jgi:hypothetical protein
MARAILDSITKVSRKQTELIHDARDRLMTLRQSVLHLQYFHNARDPSFSSEFAPVLQIVDSILLELINPTEYFPLLTAKQVTWLFFPSLLHKDKRIENLNAPLKSPAFKSHFSESFNLFTAAVNSSALAEVLPGDLDFDGFQKLVVEANPKFDDIFTRVTRQLESIFQPGAIPEPVNDRLDEFFAYGKYIDSTVWLTKAYETRDGADLACESCRLWFQLQKTQLQTAEDIENQALQERITALERENESLRRTNDWLQKEKQVLGEPDTGDLKAGRDRNAAHERQIETANAAQAELQRQLDDVQKQRDNLQRQISVAQKIIVAGQRQKEALQSRDAEIRRLRDEVGMLRARERGHVSVVKAWRNEVAGAMEMVAALMAADGGTASDAPSPRSPVRQELTRNLSLPSRQSSAGESSAGESSGTGKADSCAGTSLPRRAPSAAADPSGRPGVAGSSSRTGEARAMNDWAADEPAPARKGGSLARPEAPQPAKAAPVARQPRREQPASAKRSNSQTPKYRQRFRLRP